MRFGLGDGSEHTLEEVGQSFAVTRERIRRIEAKALRKLRHTSRSREEILRLTEVLLVEANEAEPDSRFHVFGRSLQHLLEARRCFVEISTPQHDLRDAQDRLLLLWTNRQRRLVCGNCRVGIARLKRGTALHC